MANLNNNERLNLDKLIKESDCENNTEHIRKVKHSVLLRDDIRNMDRLKTTHKDLRILDNDKFQQICQRECSFLFTNYSDIFNRLIKDELDLTIMTKLLTILKLIEDGKVDQHEGSVMVGRLLKELYVDSAIKHGENLDKQYDSEPKPEKIDGMKISWKEYKIMRG
jgi:hypothetical protein